MPPTLRTTVGLSKRLNFPRSVSPLRTAAAPPPSLNPIPNPCSSNTHVHTLVLPSVTHPVQASSSPLPPPMENPENYDFHSDSSSRDPTSILEAVRFHLRAIKTGFDGNGCMVNRLVALYAKCGHLDLARELFGESPDRNVVMWTLLISGYSRMECHEMGASLFFRMLNEGILPNKFTLASLFKCCAGFKDVDRGKQTHCWLLRNGVSSDVVLENSIVDFYAKCEAFDYAKRVFELMVDKDTVSWNIMIEAHLLVGDTHGSIELFKSLPFQDVTSWNTIIAGQMQNGAHRTALELLYQMVKTGLEFTHFTFSTALLLISTLSVLELGRQIHGKILRLGFGHNVFVRNSLIDMYCKCGKVESASAIFNGMSFCIKKLQSPSQFVNGTKSQTIAWSCMISGYVQHGRFEEALRLFREMLHAGVEVDKFSLTSMATACSDTGTIEQGKQIHACIQKLGHKYDGFLVSALIDMYAKCGSLEDARAIFDSSLIRNVVLWTSIISAYAFHGQGRDAVRLFEMMLVEKVWPNEVSYVAVLSACGHAGLVDEGQRYFRSMQEDYGIIPRDEHFTCMVDLLGRAGLLTDARDFICENEITNLSNVWTALLSACRFHNNMGMAQWASEQMVRLNPLDAASYILLSNIYATTRQWAEASRVRSLMQEKGAINHPGQSWIQLKDRVHTFVAGDRSHPQMGEIYSYLGKLIGRLTEMGYEHTRNLVLHDVEEEEREVLLSFHSEKLAIAYGIISTPNGSPIRVMKNLRVCADCHVAIKFISQATCREILLRDAYRFHHFKDGNCSCGDYW